MQPCFLECLFREEAAEGNRQLLSLTWGLVSSRERTVQRNNYLMSPIESNRIFPSGMRGFLLVEAFHSDQRSAHI